MLTEGDKAAVEWRIEEKGLKGSPFLFRNFEGEVVPHPSDHPDMIRLMAEDGSNVCVYKPWIFKVNGELATFKKAPSTRKAARRSRRRSRRAATEQLRTTPVTIRPRPASGELSVRQQSLQAGRKLGNRMYTEGWRAREDGNFQRDDTVYPKALMQEAMIQLAVTMRGEKGFLYDTLDPVYVYAHPARQRDWARCCREARRTIIALS